MSVNQEMNIASEEERAENDQTSVPNKHKRGCFSSWSREHPKKELEISKPIYFKAMVHIDVDISDPTGFRGMPEEWKSILFGDNLSISKKTHERAIEALLYNCPTDHPDLCDIPKISEADAEHLIIREDPLRFYTLLEEKIGEGGFSEVFVGVEKTTGATVAIKRTDVAQRSQIFSELELQRELHHANLVALFYCFEWEQKLSVVMEHMDRGSLAMRIGVGTPYTEPQIAYVAECLLQALAYLHRLCFLHRDVKSDNVLVNARGEVKLADFGFATKTETENAKRSSKVGTLYWMAPELIQGEEYSNKVDIWGLGITLIEMADGAPPLFSVPPLKALLQIHTGPAPTVQQPSRWSEAFLHFLARALEKDMEKRASAAELLEEPFLQCRCSREEFATFINQVAENKQS